MCRWPKNDPVDRLAGRPDPGQRPGAGDRRPDHGLLIVCARAARFHHRPAPCGPRCRRIPPGRVGPRRRRRRAGGRARGRSATVWPTSRLPKRMPQLAPAARGDWATAAGYAEAAHDARSASVGHSRRGRVTLPRRVRPRRAARPRRPCAALARSGSIVRPGCWSRSPPHRRSLEVDALITSAICRAGNRTPPSWFPPARPRQPGQRADHRSAVGNLASARGDGVRRRAGLPRRLAGGRAPR